MLDLMAGYKGIYSFGAISGSSGSIYLPNNNAIMTHERRMILIDACLYKGAERSKYLSLLLTKEIGETYTYEGDW